MTEFFRLLSYLRPYRICFANSSVLMIATGLLEGGTILLLQPIFDALSGSKTGRSLLAFLPFALPESGGSNLRIIAFLLVGFTLAKGVTEYFSSYSMSYI